MSARTFDDIYLQLWCQSLARAALAYCVGQETLRHPSWGKVAKVLTGTHVVRIARNGYMTFTVARTGRKDP